MPGKEKKSQSHRYGIDAQATLAKAIHGCMLSSNEGMNYPLVTFERAASVLAFIAPHHHRADGFTAGYMRLINLCRSAMGKCGLAEFASFLSQRCFPIVIEQTQRIQIIKEFDNVYVHPSQPGDAD